MGDGGDDATEGVLKTPERRVFGSPGVYGVTRQRPAPAAAPNTRNVWKLQCEIVVANYLKYKNVVSIDLKNEII